MIDYFDYLQKIQTLLHRTPDQYFYSLSLSSDYEDGSEASGSSRGEAPTFPTAEESPT